MRFRPEKSFKKSASGNVECPKSALTKNATFRDKIKSIWEISPKWGNEVPPQNVL